METSSEDAIEKVRQLISEPRVNTFIGGLGKPLFYTISGAHMYGFPSQDSDYDVRVGFIRPTSLILSLGEKPKQATWGVDVRKKNPSDQLDLYAMEAEHLLNNLLKSNGNYLEWFFNPLTFYKSEHYGELEHIAKQCVTKKLFDHFNHFSAVKSKDYTQTPTAKNFLYSLRTGLTGAHALLTGEVDPNIHNVLGYLAHHEQRIVNDIITHKKKGEDIIVKENDAHPEILQHAKDLLVKARNDSTLPDATPKQVHEQANDYLLRLRRYYF